MVSAAIRVLVCMTSQRNCLFKLLQKLGFRLISEAKAVKAGKTAAGRVRIDRHLKIIDLDGL